MTKKTYSVVGQKFLGLDPYLAGINAGVPAVLVREPTNAFDPNAIQVWIDGKRVGYLPKKDNAILAQFIDQAGKPWQEKLATPEIAQDGSLIEVRLRKAIDATFVRSPNSGYPQVEV